MADPPTAVTPVTDDAMGRARSQVFLRRQMRKYDYVTEKRRLDELPIRTGPNAGKTAVWIKPYIKGNDNLPLKAGDVLYLLQH
jgi:hypothetical protein